MEGLYACLLSLSSSYGNHNNARITGLMLPRLVLVECSLAWTPVLSVEF